jgi:capsular exopolysaccharide synthesis family protein
MLTQKSEITESLPVERIDLRSYLLVLVFRWQIIVLCFLLCLLGGVLYINFTPREYLTECKVMIYSEPMLTLSSDSTRWTSLPLHAAMLADAKLAERVAKKLEKEWGKRMGGFSHMVLEVKARPVSAMIPMLNVSVRNRTPEYAKAFLGALLEEHRLEWQSIQNRSKDSATRMLEEELARLREQIREAEDAVIDYMRLHDIPRMTVRSTMESEYLTALMNRKNQLTTELMLMEASTPQLKDDNVGVISEIARLSRETGAVTPSPLSFESEEGEANPSAGTFDNELRLNRPVRVETSTGTGQQEKEKEKEEAGWRELRVKLARLKQEEAELLRGLEPEHDRVKDVRKRIAEIEKELAIAKEVQLGQLKDRYRALMVHLKAIEEAEHKWQARNVLAVQRQAEYKRLLDVVRRFERNYDMLYGRLHDMRVAEELKAEHFSIPDPPSTDPQPVWPDPRKILLLALVLGLGSGVGLAFLAQILDNRVHTIFDVERDIGLPFLGGIPHWVRSHMREVVRPIVTETHKSGAIEAYRALRTTVISAMEKSGDKIAVFTSADSREGKTLTVLNLAVVVAQTGKKVLLIDMDLRRGRLHRALGVNKQPGCSEALVEERPLQEMVCSTAIDNLYFVPCGGETGISAELLQMRNIARILHDVSDEYDYVFVDTPPVLRAADAILTATRGVGVVIYVIRVNRTPKQMIKHSINMLADTRILGAILNDIELHKISGLYYSYLYPAYAYYSNAYAYGYDYYYDDRSITKTRRSMLWWIVGINPVRRLRKWFARTFIPED